MTSPSEREHIPWQFTELLMDEFGRITWAPDTAPIRIRALYLQAFSNACVRFYAKPSEGGEEGAPRPLASSSPSTTGEHNG